MTVFLRRNGSSPWKHPAQQGGNFYNFSSTGRLPTIRGIPPEAGFQLSSPAVCQGRRSWPFSRNIIHEAV